MENGASQVQVHLIASQEAVQFAMQIIFIIVSMNQIVRARADSGIHQAITATKNVQQIIYGIAKQKLIVKVLLETGALQVQVVRHTVSQAPAQPVIQVQFTIVMTKQIAKTLEANGI